MKHAIVAAAVLIACSLLPARPCAGAAAPAAAPPPERPAAAAGDTAAAWAVLLATTLTVEPAGELVTRLWQANLDGFVRVRAVREGWWYEVLLGPAADRAAVTALSLGAREAGIDAVPSAQPPPAAHPVGEPFSEAAGLMRRGAVAGLTGRPAVADSLGAPAAAPPDTAAGR